MILISRLLLLISLVSCAHQYPKHWWAGLDEGDGSSWEILPDDAKKGEVILSKRNELGVFSNFAHTPFFFGGRTYTSIEGFWQMMKYPDPKLKNDPRAKRKYPYSRKEVSQQYGFVAKKAGDMANKINKGLPWVSYKGYKFNYKDNDEGQKFHYDLIEKAIRAKVNQHPHIKALLIKTKGLKLLPDHSQGDNPPKSYQYHRILMKIRDQL